MKKKKYKRPEIINLPIRYRLSKETKIFFINLPTYKFKFGYVITLIDGKYDAAEVLHAVHNSKGAPQYVYPLSRMTYPYNDLYQMFIGEMPKPPKFWLKPPDMVIYTKHQDVCKSLRNSFELQRKNLIHKYSNYIPVLSF